MVFPTILWAIFGLAMLISAIGFIKYVYFISLGYGFSVAGIGLLMMFMLRANLTWGTFLCCLLLVVYGFRLGGYLLYRELKSKNYNRKMQEEIKDGKKMQLGVKCAIWITCALLYTMQVIPIFYRLTNRAGTDVLCVLGACVMAFGLIFESAADRQKQSSKKKDPHRFCDTGLYRIVRCPNYLGEMIFWTGAFVSGLNALQGWQWAPAILGYLGILYVMFSGARRLELRQNRTYADNEAYQKYVRTVPILLPFVPLYSVAKYSFLVG